MRPKDLFVIAAPTLTGFAQRILAGAGVPAHKASIAATSLVALAPGVLMVDDGRGTAENYPVRPNVMAGAGASRDERAQASLTSTAPRVRPKSPANVASRSASRR